MKSNDFYMYSLFLFGGDTGKANGIKHRLTPEEIAAAKFDVKTMIDLEHEEALTMNK